MQSTSGHRTAATGALAVALLYLGFISLGLPDAAFGVAWPSVRNLFALPQAQFGIALAFVGIGFVLSSTLAGRFLAAMGVGRLLALATTMAGLGLLGFAIAGEWWVFLAFALLVGFGGGAIDSGLNAYAASRLSARQMNWLHAAFGLGAGIGPLIMTAAVGLSSWRLGYVALGLVMLCLATLFTVTRGIWVPTVGEALPAQPAPVSAGAALRQPLVWLQILAFFTYAGAEIAAGQWAFAVLSQDRGNTIERAGLWTGAFWMALFAGRILLGMLAERVGTSAMLRAALVGAIAGYGLFAFDPAGAGPLGLVLAGFSLAPIFPLMMHRTPQVLPGAAGHAIGFQVSAAMLGGVATPALAGILADRSGLGAIPFFLLGVAVATAVIVELCLRYRTVRPA